MVLNRIYLNILSGVEANCIFSHSDCPEHHCLRGEKYDLRKGVVEKNMIFNVIYRPLPTGWSDSRLCRISGISPQHFATCAGDMSVKFLTNLQTIVLDFFVTIFASIEQTFPKSR